MLVVPSPKFQDQPVTLPVVVSLKFTESGAVPLTIEAEKPATGGAGVGAGVGVGPGVGFGDGFGVGFGDGFGDGS